MKSIKKCKAALLIAGVCCSASSFADVQFNGFASIKAGVVFDDEEVILNGIYDKDLSFKPESVFALQVSSDLTEGLSVTAQIFAQGKDDFDVEARWAYLSYQVSDEWRVNVGRMVLPMFYKSESEKIGYTVTGNRLPRAVYDDFEFAVVEGVRLNHSTELGDWSVNSSFGYYAWEGDFYAENNPYNSAFDKIFSVSTEFTYDWLTLFAGGFITEVDFNAIDDGFIYPIIDGAVAGINAQAGATVITPGETQSLKDTVKLSGDGVYYYLGTAIDYNDWLLTAEYADYGIKDTSDTYTKAWYVMAGKRINEYTLLYTYEEFDEEPEYTSLDGFSPYVTAIGTGVIDAVLENYLFTTQTVSLRYDFHSNAAFKLDVFSSKPKGGSAQTGISFGVDLVF